MLKNLPFLFLLSFFLISLLIAPASLLAQNDVVEEVRTVAVAGGIGFSEDDDGQMTGATVRGRISYEDTGRPVRYVPVTLINADPKTGAGSHYSSKYVKTDENGEFLIRNVKAGSYYVYIKSDGILNPDVYSRSPRIDPTPSKADDLFEKVSVSGLGEFQVFVSAKRGGAISGFIRYADGEAAVGVGVEALKKEGEKYSPRPIGGMSDTGQTKTDDRGFYRFPGLPEGEYIIRVIEPVSHSAKPLPGYGLGNDVNQGLLKTYFPEGETTKTAKTIAVFRGQEQTSIDITIPERKLYDVYGRIVDKSTGQPLGNFSIRFYPIAEPDEGFADGSFLMAMSSMSPPDTNSLGEWSLKNLPKGKYRITASQINGYIRSDQGSIEKKKQYPSISKEIEITGSDLTDVIFEMPLSATLSGTILTEDGSPLPKFVSLFAVDEKTKAIRQSEYIYPNSSGSGKSQQTPKNQTEFRIENLLEGNYHLFFADRAFYIKSFIVEGRQTTDGAIALKEGEEMENIKVILGSDMGTVAGKIANFNPQNKTAVVLVKGEGNIERTNPFFGEVKPDGTFSVKAAPGEYRAVVFSPKADLKTREEYYEWLRSAMENAPSVTVRPKETSTVNLTMPQ
ncbi:MAG: carboxypeptidase regulatory-like domain-containing protein [Pyrinomonadaceae bacterium]